MLGGINGYGINAYGMNNFGYGGFAGTQLSTNAANAGVTGVGASGTTFNTEDAGSIKNPDESTQVQPGKKSSPAECQTCKERKYQDGSNEMVSFKAAAHISPNAAAGAVMSHEQEHVANAYKKASLKDGKVIQASVSIHTAVCPECGRTYVSGGTTTTQIKYGNESNPYQKDRKAADAIKLIGNNVDMAG